MFLCIAWFHYQSSTVLPCYVFLYKSIIISLTVFFLNLLSFALLTSSTPLDFMNMFLCIAWFHRLNSIVHVCPFFFLFLFFFHAVLANEPQSINCLYKHWTVKNNYLTDLHFINLARISCWPALTEIHYR